MTKIAAQQAMRAGRLHEARDHLLPLLGTAEDGPELRYNLAMILVRLSDFAGAAVHFESSLRAAPGNPDILNNLGNCQRLSGRLEAARRTLEAGLHAAPTHTGLMANRAWLHLAMDEPGQASTCFRKVLAQDPDSLDAVRGLADALSQMQQWHDARDVVDEGLRQFPQSAPLLQIMGALSARLREPEQAREYFERALAADPDNPETLLNLGIIAEQLGELEVAERYLTRALAARPGYAPAHFHLAHLTTHQPTGEEIASIETALRSAPAGQARVDLGFALGKSLSRIAEYAKAFEAFRKARNEMSAVHPFDNHAAIERLQKICQQSHRCSTATTVSLIFVVGMPRSGTTLVDQVLASHSSVLSRGESGAVGHMLAHYGDSLGAAYPEKLPALDNALRERLADILRGHLVGDHAISVDTTPDNLRYVGLLAELLPEAMFIYCQRDSRDTCVSIYEQPLTEVHGYANRLEDLGTYYRASFDLATHWIELLGDRLHTVQYERLVADPSREIKQVLEACGLPYEEQCLEFHSYRRAVLTPSAAQVRQPMNTQSVGRWKRYRDQLSPLMQALPEASFYEP